MGVRLNSKSFCLAPRSYERYKKGICYAKRRTLSSAGSSKARIEGLQESSCNTSLNFGEVLKNCEFSKDECSKLQKEIINLYKNDFDYSPRSRCVVRKEFRVQRRRPKSRYSMQVGKGPAINQSLLMSINFRSGESNKGGMKRKSKKADTNLVVKRLSLANKRNIKKVKSNTRVITDLNTKRIAKEDIKHTSNNHKLNYKQHFPLFSNKHSHNPLLLCIRARFIQPKN
eukprot:TRINITY_DN13793_c0_g1_i1.p1 TRINITY_DN13793_c0_g1~~TRINITY_DN13793_c0_g1_i1.p1  ORF type:complete len:228 (-),score=43.70 TRINITY_DN13793_c0_g1_i1:165-848(-)